MESRLNGSRRERAGGRRHRRLRGATAAAHEALDVTLREAACFASAEGYRRYLTAVEPLYASVEAELGAAGATRLLPDWPRRRKLDLICADLRVLGGADGAPRQRAAAARMGTLPAPGWCVGAMFGTIYVLEGATLGGALLARALRGLGVLSQGRACLLDPYGAERGAMWRAFLARLEDVVMTRQQEEALSAGALATFSLFAGVGASLVDRGGAR
ncbi:MAG TPA: biliverdin-producing heme oxygenase [Acetobacteraceae bacterium]|nr:biliverdin-producing heme oxygenase [Acetobacteraceae bacterium]